MNPAIGLPEHQRRRARLMAAMGPGAVAFVPSAELTYRNRDVEHPFRQDSDFHYLTGLAEAGCLLALAPGREAGECVVFCQPRDERMERYRGELLGPERAAAALGVDESLPSDALDAALPGLLAGRSRVYATLGAHPAFDQRLIDGLRTLRGPGPGAGSAPDEVVALGRLLHEQRLFKSPTERQLMAHAADITAAAHRRAMRHCAPGMTEAELEAELLHEFTRQGARAPAYPPIVAAGANACVMHYTRNDAPLRDGDLVLIDAGCEHHCYAADVTRTFPANGRFSPPQRDLYEVVLAAQRAALAAAKPGAAFNAPEQAATRLLAQGLIDLGILTGDIDQVLADRAHEPFTIHRCSHWLGLDVHDVGSYRVNGDWRALQPGMALTIEPGLYFPAVPGSPVPAPWLGMGVRIEDDVVIGRPAPALAEPSPAPPPADAERAEGAQILSAAVPKAIDDIEALMNG